MSMHFYLDYESSLGLTVRALVMIAETISLGILSLPSAVAILGLAP